MRFLVLICLSSLLMCVAVSPTHAAMHILCPPENTISGITTYPSIKAGIIVINEILSNPGSNTLWNCATQMNSPWIELFNTQNQAYNLSSFAALDHGPGTTRYYLTGNSMIAAHGYLVLFPNIFIFQNQTPLLRLLFEGVSVDEVALPTLGIDQSYARLPDGGRNWKNTNAPTIGISNTSSTTITSTPPTATVQKNTTKTAQTSKKKQKQQGIYTDTSTIPTVIQHTNRQKSGTTIQPTWSEIHLPQPPSNAQLTPGIVTSPPSPISKAPATPWPIFTGLLGFAGFSSIIGVILYKYKKRQKVT